MLGVFYRVGQRHAVLVDLSCRADITIWYGVYNNSTRELTYASGGHPPALFYDGTYTDGSNATFLRTANKAIGAMPDVIYEKSKHLVDEQAKLYILSDGVYEVEKSDGSMWQFREFSDFMAKIKTDGRSALDRLYQHALNLGDADKFEADFTIVEVAFG
jgi:sigma-B regulation protein RsbU (phosphoserine phosphatase)